MNAIVAGTSGMNGAGIKGYWLNRAFNDLREPAARFAWLGDLDSYLARYPLTDDEKQCITNGDWVGCLERGASVYTLTKVGAVTGVSLLQMGAQMRGLSMEEFVAFLANQNAQLVPYYMLPEATEDVDG